jgi:hypothetical protein
MYTIKVLKRKDAASVVVAIIIAMTFVQTMFLPISQLSYKVANLGNDVSNYGGYGGGWRDTYLNPFIEIIFTFILIEILIRLFVVVRPLFVRKK